MMIYLNGSKATVSDGGDVACITTEEGVWTCSWEEVGRACKHPTGNLTPRLMVPVVATEEQVGIQTAFDLEVAA